MHITGEEAAVINVAIGAVLASGASALNQFRVRRDAQATRRREAYAALILALDHLERAWKAPETLEDEYESKKMGAVTGQAVREIQRGYVAVLLVGSKKAEKEARKVRETAWALNDYLNGGSRRDALKSELPRLFDAFSAAGAGFIEVAEHESSH